MNWEKSRALTPLKADFLKAFFAIEKRFFLTGGSALGLFYLDHRLSYDLDLFTTETVEWPELDGIMRLCARSIGAQATILRDSPTFRRYLLERNVCREIIDVVLDACPQVDTEKPWMQEIRVDTLNEIMRNKITTLISRCEIKDLVDLYFLEKEGLTVEAFFEEARLKDGGLDPAMISLLLDSVQITQVPEFMIKPLSAAELSDYVADLKRRMALLAYPDKE